MASNNVRLKTALEIQKEYPLHWNVWQNNPEELEKQLQEDQVRGVATKFSLKFNLIRLF